MKVKKRTVWFLTLFSLAAVISVYYLFDGEQNFAISTIFSDKSLEDVTLTSLSESVAVNSESDLFQQIRMELSNERSQLKEQYTQKIASTDYTAEEKNAAFNEMNALIEQQSSEATLEMLIQSLGYTDSLVRIDRGKVDVTVIADEMTNAKANEIIYIVKSELEDAQNVTVKAQPSY